MDTYPFSENHDYNTNIGIGKELPKGDRFFFKDGYAISEEDFIKMTREIDLEFNKFDTHEADRTISLLEGLTQQTVKTKWVTAEIDRITALIYFMIIISLFIVATQLYGDFLPKFTQSFGNIETTKLVILIFSIAALTAVSMMLLIRIRGLQKKASIVFKYLVSLGAIKVGKEKFKETLQDIERYLNDNDWSLAEYWINRTQPEYTELFLDKIKELRK